MGEVPSREDRDSTAQILRPRSEFSRGEAYEKTLRRLRMTAVGEPQTRINTMSFLEAREPRFAATEGKKPDLSS